METTYIVQYETEFEGEFCKLYEMVITVGIKLNRRKLTEMISIMHPNYTVIINDYEEQEYGQ
jgi:hypothetical protein